MATPQQETERPLGRGEATPPRAAGATGSQLGRPCSQRRTPKPESKISHGPYSIARAFLLG